MLRLKETLQQHFQVSTEQAETDPEKQAAFLQEQVQKYKSTMKNKTLSLEKLNQTEIQLTVKNNISQNKLRL